MSSTEREKSFHRCLAVSKNVKMSFNYLVVCAVLFCGVGETVGNQFTTPSARITLISLDSGNLLRTITNKANHEVVLTVPTTYSQAYVFECNSSYPVEWNYIGEGAPTTTADVGRHFKDFYNVNSYTYQSILYMYRLEELQSGRYVCRGSNPEKEKLQIHYDLFVPGNGSRILISNAEKNVFVPESKLLTSLPCEVTDPSVSINLYKGDDWGAFHRVDMNDSIIFRPRKGFILKLHELPNPFGTYMCTTPDNKGRRKVHVIPDRLKAKYDSSSHLNGKVPVTMSYDLEYNRMLCCSGSGASFAPRLQWAGCSSVVDCKIKSVCFEEDRCEPQMGHFGLSDIQNRVQDPGPLPKGCSGRKLRDDPNGDYGIFKCSTPGVNQYQPYILNRGNIFTDFEVAPPSEAILTLTKSSSEPLYIGSEVEYHCNSTRFYFAYGIRWAFKRGNDEIEFIDDASSHIVKDRYLLTSHRRQTTFRILQPDIKAIICFVPIANSPTEWRTVSLPITIRDSFLAPTPTGPMHGHNHGLPGQLSDQQQRDYISNRIPYTSHSQPQPVVEPYSTLRPKLYLNNHNQLLNSPSLEPTPTPSVDIDDIISLGKKRRPVHPDPTPYVNIDSISRDHERVRDYLYSTSKNVNQNPANGFRFPSPVDTNPPDLITIDSLRDIQNQQQIQRTQQHQHQPLDQSHNAGHNFNYNNNNNYPNSLDIEDANQRHRDRFNMKGNNIYPTATPTPLAIPKSTTPSPYSQFNDRSQYIHSYERKDFQDRDPINGFENYHVSSKSTGVKVHSTPKPFKSSSSEIFYNRDRNTDFYKNDYTNPTPISPTLRKQRPRPRPQEPEPVRYFKEKHISEDDSLETFSPIITPSKSSATPLPPSNPVIHFDSTEKQYGLREPMDDNQNWRKKTSQPQDIPKSEGYYPHSSFPSTPPLKDSRIRTSSTHRDYNSYKNDYYSKPKTPVPEAELSVPFDDLDALPYASEDYYMSSLREKMRKDRFPSTTEKPMKPLYTSPFPHRETNRNPYELDTAKVATDVDSEYDRFRKFYHPNQPSPTLKFSPTKDQDYKDRESNNYYLQRYADSKESSGDSGHHFESHNKQSHNKKPRARARPTQAMQTHSYSSDHSPGQNYVRRNGFVHREGEYGDLH